MVITFVSAETAARKEQAGVHGEGEAAVQVPARDQENRQVSANTTSKSPSLKKTNVLCEHAWRQNPENLQRWRDESGRGFEDGDGLAVALNSGEIRLKSHQESRHSCKVS
jgi:hypothetical protein